MMTMIKPVYAPLGAVGVILWERLYTLHRWRWRDLAAGAAAVLSCGSELAKREDLERLVGAALNRSD
jgi:hypothetical protein